MQKKKGRTKFCNSAFTSLLTGPKSIKIHKYIASYAIVHSIKSNNIKPKLTESYSFQKNLWSYSVPVVWDGIQCVPFLFSVWLLVNFPSRYVSWDSHEPNFLPSPTIYDVIASRNSLFYFAPLRCFLLLKKQGKFLDDQLNSTPHYCRMQTCYLKLVIR